MGTEDWILKGTELITNTKKQRLKIQSRRQTLKNTILNKQKIAKVIKNKYLKFALKIVFSPLPNVIDCFKDDN